MDHGVDASGDQNIPCSPRCSGKPCGADDGCGTPCAGGSGCCPADMVVAQGKCARPLRVLSYNIAAYMNDLANPNQPLYGDPEPQLQKLAAYIKQHDIHLVGLQEVENNATWHNSVHMHNRLIDILGAIGHPMQGHFQKRFDAHGGEFGISLLSRWPLSDYQAQLVASNVYLQSANLDFYGETIRFYNYHPYPGAGACDATTTPAFQNAVSAHLDKTSVITGDFNLLRSASCYSSITASHFDACSTAGDGSCLSTVDLAIRTDIAPPSPGIDYVFVRFAGAAASRWQVTGASSDHTINQGVVMSDHFPVLVEFLRTELP